jgi:4-hydroxysphinganine ceramide fatty acyl 2-hydroxylase
MKNEDPHDHSDSAYDMLEEYVIGCLGTESTVVRDGAHSSCALPENTLMEQH